MLSLYSKDLIFLNFDSNQTQRMPMLILVFVVHTDSVVGFTTQLLISLQLLRKNPNERLGGGPDDAIPVKVGDLLDMSLVMRCPTHTGLCNHRKPLEA